MQNDLISRSALIEALKREIMPIPQIEEPYNSFYHNSGYNCAMTGAWLLVENQPTAYSVESVVERLKEDSTLPITEDEECWILLDDAIKIVKAGGTDGQTN